MNDTYILTVIDEVETPLAETMGSTSLFPSFVGTAILAVLIAIGLVIGFYAARCLRLYRRYEELCVKTGTNADKSIKWDAGRIRDEITGLELETAGNLLRESSSETAG